MEQPRDIVERFVNDQIDALQEGKSIRLIEPIEGVRPSHRKEYASVRDRRA
jgi:hypothetical protein